MKKKNNKIPGMHAWITDITNDPKSAKKATASVQIGNLMYIKGINIYASGEGLYIVMPKHEETDKDGTKTLVSSVESGSHEFRYQLHSAVMDAYDKALNRFFPGSLGTDGGLPFEL